MDLVTFALAKKYINNKVAELISAGWEKKIVTSLPEVGSEKTIYMIERTDSNGNIYYDEYMYTNGRYDSIGTTKTDLAGYAKKKTSKVLALKLGLIKKVLKALKPAKPINLM